MTSFSYTEEVLGELERSLSRISESEAGRMVDAILQAERVFLAGAGRSGLMGRAFAMRLMHLGIDAHVVGDTVTPAVRKGDLLLVGTGSGETQSLVGMCRKAAAVGASIAAVTISPESTVGGLADLCVKVQGSPKDQADGDGRSSQPMGSLFEQTLLLFYDTLVLRIMHRKGLDSKSMFANHANLE